jgi:ATP-dependent DNA helicase RecG
MKLSSSVSELPLVGPIYANRLKKLNIYTIEDLLYHVPHRYVDYRSISIISSAKPGEIVTIKGSVASIKNTYTKSKKKIQEAQIHDNTGTITAIWFNQPYLVRTIKKGVDISLAGKIDWYARKKALISPEYEIFTKNMHTGRLVPIYHETARVSSKWLRSRIAYALDKARYSEFLPTQVLDKNDLVEIHKAFKDIHFPQNLEIANFSRKRLAFNELLFLNLTSALKKLDWKRNETASNLVVNKKLVSEFLGTFPFTLTTSQKRSVDEILLDLSKDVPMNRLLEGDVGSGKTVVAAIGAFVSFINGYQTVFMAPTQILAQQHFDTLNNLLHPYKVRTSLITSAGTKSDPGVTDIYIGTHSLIHKRVNFDKVAFVVIDEQHRFGVEQRAHLIKKTKNKSEAPHILTMTATPIPRTIALTIHGDLDLSTLDELPGGRKPITTWIVPPQKREGAYKWLGNQIKTHNIQVFVICPLIEESEKETMKQVKSAISEYEKLQKIFPDLKVGLLHGRLKSKEKEKVLQRFRNKKTDILVSTAVVEVGIDIPNATVMIVEGADRFGLAQLHQLRGRVGRGKKKSYCLLFSEIYSKKILTRLNALRRTLSGFELAELDLKLRGPGEVFGLRQHGYSELKVASWQDRSLIKQTRKVADDIVNNPDKYKKLFTYLKKSNIVPN